jgi:hypothetical protein
MTRPFRGSKLRREIAVKAILKTWPELATRDVRRLTPTDCQTWAARALREGTGFVAPNAKTIRQGMSSSAFNKCVDALRAILEVARELGVIYKNPAADICKARVKQKRLELPSANTSRRSFNASPPPGHAGRLIAQTWFAF